MEIGFFNCLYGKNQKLENQCCFELIGTFAAVLYSGTYCDFPIQNFSLVFQRKHIFKD